MVSDHERARGLLRSLGVGDKVDSYPSQLSMGEQKRVAIARALLNEPEILLADEPTSELDEATEKEVMGIITDVHKQSATVVMVTHSSELAGYGSRHLKMVSGVLSEG
jgi:ABC-type lipoprotein export system ATPase subunit